MRKSLNGVYGVEKDMYWNLPKELEEFNYYINDGDTGHVIMAIPESELAEAEKNGDLDMFECPFPVKYVLEKGYKIYKNHVVCDGKYDSFLGLQIDPKYFETERDTKKESGEKSSQFTAFGVGEVVTEYKGLPERTLFDMTDSGAIMVVLFNNPTEKEIEQFHSENPFEIRFVEMKNVIMITTKIGSLNWMDATYTVHLSQNLTHMPVIEDGNGIALMLMLVDTMTGKVKALRMLGLSTKFSVALCKAIDRQREMKFDKGIYDLNVERICAAYKTSDLVKFSSNYCKIH